MKLPSSPDVINLTKQTFSKEFLKFSSKLNEVSEILWFMFKTGGSTPIGIISARFPNFPDDLPILKEAGILELRSEKFALFTEKFEENITSKDLTKITLQDINSILLNNYWSKLTSKFGLEGLENSLAIVLSSVILSSKPNQPAFLSKVLRTCDSLLGDIGNVFKNAVGDPQLILEHYLNRNLGLVNIGNNEITLTEKAEKMIRRNQFLWKVYVAKEKPKLK